LIGASSPWIKSDVDTTTVAIIGAGPAGLTLANLLQRSGVDCVVLERRSRSYMEQRQQRAGVLEHRAARMLEEWGLGDQVLAGIPVDGLLEFRVDGVPRHLDVPALAGGRHSRLMPQQVLVQRLTVAFEAGGGDLRTEAEGVALYGLDGDRPVVRYNDAAGMGCEFECDYVAGCDGFRGLSRRSVPEGALTTYTYDHGTRCWRSVNTGSRRTSPAGRMPAGTTWSAHPVKRPRPGPTTVSGSNCGSGWATTISPSDRSRRRP
jgi:p-hydroxybenzoate 3-monooxygenase